MQKIFTNQDIQISYTDNGVGDIVVLLHGFGEDGSIWKNQIDFLARFCRVIVPDIPGSGSSPILNKKDISIEDYASCIHQFLKNILPNQETKIKLLGHSMGGYITMAYAKLFPQQLNAFGMIHSTAFADSDEKKQVRLRGIETIKQYGAYSFLKTTIPNLFAADFKQKNYSDVSALVEKSKHFSEAALEQYYLAMMNRADTTDILKKSELPVLFIVGSEDIAAPLQDSLQQCHLPSQSHIHILEKVGHMGMMESAESVSIFINQFLSNSIITN
jgi:pimeloyl-ACP methyl ester carboxylesterase